MVFRLSIALGIAALAFVIWPTGHASQSLLRDYQARLNRVLSGDAILIEPTPQVLLAPMSQRRVPIGESKITLNEALDLGPCGLVPLLAQNNSALGKVAADSTRLIYTIRLIDAAQSCDSEDAEVQALLAQLLEFKTQQLPKLRQNVVFASEETQAFFKASATPLGPDDAISLAPLTRLISVVRENDADAIEPSLQALNSSNAGGALLNAKAWIMSALPPLTRQVDQGQCSSAQKTAIEGVFSAVYVERLQPWLAAVTRASRTMEAALANYPHPLPNWRSDAVGAEELISVAREHAQAWQGLLSRCGTRVQPLSQ